MLGVETPENFPSFLEVRLHGCTIAAVFSGDGTVRICFSYVVRTVPSSMVPACRPRPSHHTTAQITSESSAVSTHTRNSHRFTTRRGGAFKRDESFRRSMIRQTGTRRKGFGDVEKKGGRGSRMARARRSDLVCWKGEHISFSNQLLAGS